MTVLKKAAEYLDMAIPEEDVELEQTNAMLVVEPHEIVIVPNDDLPAMVDIDTSLIQGERQLEDLINTLTTVFKENVDKIDQQEAKYKGRYMEVMSMIAGHAIDAVKHKNELQLKKSEHRMKRMAFVKNRATPRGLPGQAEDAAAKQITNNVFFTGTREDALELAKAQLGQQPEPPKPAETVVEVQPDEKS